MSEGGALVRFHDWRVAGDRKAATRRPIAARSQQPVSGERRPCRLSTGSLGTLRGDFELNPAFVLD
jgi:hypothetical protein